ncbi:hypothetical protein FN846DRAFT_950928 [Sphaerosporella brunnea]|uniref:BZIP domain-containing protein n=1 Tax=Sphaerosporella brunnea TaxID=1250544 RepID=A0A5J5EVC6_9PEZI|nr:hypothetical protein FN846DRAFT_950928 [Sphaerosporella brunnea]
MSQYGRRGINVSAYLQDLNTIPSADEQVDTYNPDDLDPWTNIQFIDFDMGEYSHDQQEEQKPTIVDNAPAPIDPSLRGVEGNEPFTDFLNELKEFSEFDYSPAFSTLSAPESQHSVPTPVVPHILPNVAPRVSPQQQPIAASPVSPYPASNPASPAAAATPTPTPSAPAPRGTKRKISVSSPENATTLEEASRLAAEEDKRRRNTAASARFRIKKKQKEQQLEKTAKEMTDRVQQLEQRIQQLELENKWLKGLIVEKNGGKVGEEMLMPPSILAGSKDGVGTLPAGPVGK